MKNKKGFTIIELLAVSAITGMHIANTMIAVNNMLTNFLKCFITFPLFSFLLNIFLVPGEAEVCICFAVNFNLTAALSPVRLNLKFIY